jgi:uncharacterized membrane protein YeiH
MKTFVLFLELTGTVAFAVSGAMTGLKKKMDVFGVAILGLTAAVGGGVLRDVVMGVLPPKTFRDPTYAFIAVAVAFVVFIPAIHRRLLRRRRLFESILVLMDALGLGIFTVIGIRTAYEVSSGFNAFLLIFVGVATGVGGGLMRDLLAGDMPFIFVRNIYASASATGAAVCVVLWKYAGGVLSMMIGTAVIVLLRLLSFHFNWHLPRAVGFDDPGR